MKIGYARVSTLEQSLDLQRDALKAAGCAKVITDQASAAVSARPGLEKMKEQLRAGDTLVIWRLDRLGRSLRDLIGWMTYLEEEKVGLLSLHEAIDTTTTSGKLTFHLFGALAEFERNLIRERTQAGLAAARSRGKNGSRPPALDKDKRDLAVRLYHENTMPIAKICSMLGISKPTLYAYVRSAEGAAYGRRQAPHCPMFQARSDLPQIGARCDSVGPIPRHSMCSESIPRS
ncbi:recombinase family protein [Sphingomonas cavernae]|uniref:Recombinase family protein n=1 Tax=Sphingomonas cavernae TaxID=2320861 RepID=A0A418WJP2_9SPHN|nr:recombinase family protein [Sphingomonas cavernae]RJF90235.1 recombinase family protein [Sphingomonas cavernae]